MRRLLSTVLFCVCAHGGSGCGGSTSEATAPGDPTEDAAATKPEGPEQECIAKADPGTGLPDDAPTRITVSHIVVKHVDAASAPDDVTRTRGAACLRAQEALDRLKGGEEFAEVVAAYSEEPGAATRDGSLGEVKADDVAPTFAAAAFALDPGQVSYIVETKFGFHIILRTD